MNLLGLPAIKGLHLLLVHHNLECYPTNAIKQVFPSLFTGLGTLQDDYEIQVKQDAQPFSLGAARNIPLPLCDKVKQELDVMEAQGFISKVQKPNPWCTGMVVVKQMETPKSVSELRRFLGMVNQLGKFSQT